MTAGLAVGGAISAVFFSMVVIKRPTPRMTFFANMAEGLMLVGVGIWRGLWGIIVMLAVIGVSEGVVNTIAPSVNRTIIPRRIFGRVISFMIVLMSASEPLAKAAAGWVIGRAGVSRVLVWGGVIEILVVAIAFFLAPVRNYARAVNSDKDGGCLRDGQ